MQRTLRTFMTGLLVAAMSISPASAWHFFRGGCGGYGGYSGYSGYGGCYSYGPAYSSYYSRGGNCGSYGYASYGSWGSYDGCYSDCGSCGGGDCGGYYDSYGGCSSCGGEVVVDHGEYYHDAAPGAPIDTTPSTTTPAPREPSRVTRPSDATETPELPPEPAPGTAQPTTPLEEETTTPDDDLFGPTTPLDTTPPAETTPPESTEMEDFFGTDPADTTPPAEIPTTPPAETTPTEPAGDDLFGPLDSTEGTPMPPAEGTGIPAEMTPPQGTPPAEDAPADDAMDIFGSSHGILREPGGLASNELRKWVDNTGKYACQGRLVRFLDNKVQLLKENGRTTTVPLYRLSALDLEFVNRQASAQHEMVDRLVKTMGTMSLAAN